MFVRNRPGLVTSNVREGYRPVAITSREFRVDPDAEYTMKNNIDSLLHFWGHLVQILPVARAVTF